MIIMYNIELVVPLKIELRQEAQHFTYTEPAYSSQSNFLLSICFVFLANKILNYLN